MQPITMFNEHFRTAQAMLKVYQLLDAQDDHPDVVAFEPKLRTMMSVEDTEPLTLLLNDLFLGAVRERANLSTTFFERPNLALLLRQAVASSCTALDVFLPSLLEAHLPTVVQVRQRHFLPRGGEAKTLFGDVRFKLEDVAPFLEEPDAVERWNLLSRKVLDHCKRKTLSTVDGISGVMMMLGVDEPWKEIAARAEIPQGALRGQIQTLVRRRNDIVHRGDRRYESVGGPPESIDLAWTRVHVNAVDSVAHICNEMARESVLDMTLGEDGGLA